MLHRVDKINTRTQVRRRRRNKNWASTRVHIETLFLAVVLASGATSNWKGLGSTRVFSYIVALVAFAWVTNTNRTLTYSQQHAGLQHKVLQPQQEVTRHGFTFFVFLIRLFLPIITILKNCIEVGQTSKLYSIVQYVSSYSIEFHVFLICLLGKKT